ncbi:DUF3467 domain-containing protein [Persicobacter psychrovividus]|uniref:DUF3467 domain-containing protein n=1 Tax=Persicobacter psychrovividus TaxID=387638 RepID=A0ABN6LB80_9BACT|nr:hypothetical protein PEPS_23640 [Persicobacter psychrovividus]
MQNPEQDQKPQQGGKIDIELPEEMAEGVYANLAMIAHSNSEFVLDFIRIMPGVPKAKVKSRVVLTPEHAVRLLQALQDNIAKYEAMCGPIGQNNPSGDNNPYNFGGPVGEA